MAEGEIVPTVEHLIFNNENWPWNYAFAIFGSLFNNGDSAYEKS